MDEIVLRWLSESVLHARVQFGERSQDVLSRYAIWDRHAARLNHDAPPHNPGRAGRKKTGGTAIPTSIAESDGGTGFAQDDIIDANVMLVVAARSDGGE